MISINWSDVANPINLENRYCEKSVIPTENNPLNIEAADRVNNPMASVALFVNWYAKIMGIPMNPELSPARKKEDIWRPFRRTRIPVIDETI